MAPPPSLRAAAGAYLRKDLLMVLHHAAMVLVCFPVAAVSGGREAGASGDSSGKQGYAGDMGLAQGPGME